MAWDADGYELLFYAASAGYLVLAVVVVRAGPTRPTNRWLGAVLVIEALLAFLGPWQTITTDPTLAYGFARVWVLIFALLPPVYVGFLGTLPTRLGRALRRRAWRTVPWSLPVAVLASLLVRPGLLVHPFDPTVKDPWEEQAGPLMGAVQGLVLLVTLLGLVAALLFWRQSQRGTSLRRQGAMFALAYGLHDGGLLLTVGVYTLAKTVGAAGPAAWVLAYYGLPTVKAVFLALLAYGILHAQLLDIDLKVKWTVSRGTAIAVLAAGFSAAKETLEYFLPGEGLLANLAGASAVAVLAWPAARAGRALSNRLLPHVEGSESFLAARRAEVFRASLESIAADGVVTDRERRMLEVMAAKLGIPAGEAQAIEADVMRSARGAPSTSPIPM